MSSNSSSKHMTEKKSYADIVSQQNTQNTPSTSYNGHNTQPFLQKKTSKNEKLSTAYKIINEIISKIDIPDIFKDFLLKLLPPL